MAPNLTRVLISPLDWGLGHVTRCIPVIKVLHQKGCKVFVAATLPGITLLKHDVPYCEFLPIEGYNITYRKTPQKTFWGLLAQIPGVNKKIRKEHNWLEQTIETYKIEAVISDNRFGFYTKKVPCIYITHQLQIATGYGFTNYLASLLHRRIINKFTTCWVPDVAQKPNLAGMLSHPKKLPFIPVVYVGPLSRFSNIQLPKKEQWLLLLSGPEPQRTLLEQKLLAQLPNHISTVLVRGLPVVPTQSLQVKPNVTVYDHLPAAMLQTLLAESNIVVARSGYSTIMDLVALQKPALLVPTPGQAEQIYLAKKLKQDSVFYTVQQHDLQLEKDVANIILQINMSDLINDNALENAVDKLLTKQL